MLLHSFSPTRQWFEDYVEFVSLFGIAARPDSIVGLGHRFEVAAYIGSVCGDERYLSV